MSRYLISLAAFSAMLPLMVDSALKGTVLLAAAGLVALLFHKASAAARHLVWLVAVVALLVVPLLSVALPQWRVLPGWAAVPVARDVVAAPRPAAEILTNAENRADGISRTNGPYASTQEEHSGKAGSLAAAESAAKAAGIAGPLETRAVSPLKSGDPPWRAWLPLAWLAGFSLLGIRLLAAHWLVRRAVRGCRLLEKNSVSDERIANAFAAAGERIGLRRRVTLLVDGKRTIPVVWGVIRPCLLLPAEALDWDSRQLRSVLLHELAHLKRRDPLAQWLTQAACALHWWNPLVWLAAWRLHVERERACDDMVLATGVRPSDYAGHLLHVASQLSPARWTSACGLAMARKSSLEGRLAAVLSGTRNRRGVTRLLTTAAVLLGCAVAIPLAMLQAAPAPESKSRGTEKGRAQDELFAPPSASSLPKHEYAQSLLRKWQARARTDGKIPGALIGHVAEQVENFIRQYPDEAGTPKLAELRGRFDVSRDWTLAEAVALLDDVCAISTAPVSWTNLPMEFNDYNSVKPGKPLPDTSAGAAWGVPGANGLRAAWVLEPICPEVRAGTVLKARVLFHNAGREPVIFRTETWHQSDPHVARDANGAEIKVTGTFNTGLTPLAVYRLSPGQYCEVGGHGIAVGEGKYLDEFSTGGVGAVIEAKAGDEVALTHTVDAAAGISFSRPDDPKDPEGLWRRQVTDRVAEEAPLPAAKADREQLIRRVMLDLTGVEPAVDAVAAFTSDGDAGALDRLVERILTGPRVEPWTGKLPTGVTKFRVAAADPDAAKAPRTAVAPGRYVLGENAHLQVTRITTADGGQTNKARILFLPSGPKPSETAQPTPYDIDLPDSDAAYAFVWERDANSLWVTEIREDGRGPGKVTLRAFDFSNPADVKLTHGSGSGNGGEWSWGKVMPAAFQRPVLEALGERGKRLRDFLPSEPARRIDRAKLEGAWAGEADGVRVDLQFLWLSEHRQAGWTVRRNGSNITADMSVVIEPDGGTAKLIFRKGLEFEATQGRLTPGEEGALLLEIIPNPNAGAPGYPAAKRIVLHRNPDAPSARTTAEVGPGPASETGVMLKPATEQKLKWGEGVNGLQMALAWPPSLGEPGLGNAPEFYLVVRNVSKAAVHFKADADSPNPRRLQIRKNGHPLSAIGDAVPIPGDWVLQPGRAAFVRLFHVEEKQGDGSTTSSVIEADIRAFPQYSMTAEMTIAAAPAGVWTGRLMTGETRGCMDVTPPRSQAARDLLKSWETARRTDGGIPGALIGRLAESVGQFIQYNPAWETVPRLEKLLARFDSSHDWSGEDAVRLLDELAALQESPVEMALDRENQEVIRTGAPLPPELADAPWGEPSADGLRLAWLLEPNGRGHRIGTALKARCLIHNSGREPVVLRARTWNQPEHRAVDAKGAEIKTPSTAWMTRGLLLTYRLAPGEFIEQAGPGIGVGPMGKPDDWNDTRVGTWIEAMPGDDVTLSTAAVALRDGNQKPESGGGEDWWRDCIQARLSRHLPFPAEAKARERLLYRIAMELFGTPVSTEINGAFDADTSQSALNSLTKLLMERPGQKAFEGTLTSGVTKFRVLAPAVSAAGAGPVPK
ncbi:MAG: hypothetical protein JWM59_385 [Verrucomicrobiales bacterium]|nr:hypothetical protein [Verrucomicrobiales bacterium]